MTTSPVPRLTFWIIMAEVIAVFSLMLVYIWGFGQFSVSLTLTILALALASNAVRGEGCRHVGFSWNNFVRGARSLAPAVIGLSVLLLVGGALEHTFRDVTTRTAAVGFRIYCVWGLFQQYLLNGFFLNRLVELAGGMASHWLLLPLALVFSLIHAPNWFLMAVTLPAGFLSGLFYLRFRNLFVLALAHALLGCLLYLVIPDSISHSLYVGPHYLVYHPAFLVGAR
jgi:membrane protease YdiL (CAAX protease family)